MRYIVVAFLLPWVPPALAVDCPPTQAMTPGTHFKPITAHKVDVGRGLVVRGTIRSSRDCRPIAGARVAHWQANDQGVYDDRLRAYLYSGQNGEYRFRSQWPAAMVPHIHFKIEAEGYRGITTQWVGAERVDEIVFDVVLEPENR